MRRKTIRVSAPLTSALRQPGRTLLFIGIIVIISFAFLVRAFEGLIVMREFSRLEAQNHAAGVIRPIEPLEWRVKELQVRLEEHPLVEYVDALRIIQGVMDEVYTPDYGGFTPFVNKMFVYGTLMEKEHFPYADFFTERALEEQMDFFPLAPYLDIYVFTIFVDTVVVSLPELATPGEKMKFAFVDYRKMNEHIYTDAEIGQRYFLGGQFSRELSFMESEIYMNGQMPFPHITGVVHSRHSTLGERLILHPLNPTEEVFLYPVGENGQVESLSVLEQIGEEIAVLRENIHTIFLRPTRDLEINPISNTLDMSSIFLLEGRLITQEDYEEKNPVAVIRAEFAEIRNLQVGDTINTTMRESSFVKEFILPNVSRMFPLRSIGNRVAAADWALERNPLMDAIEYDGTLYHGFWRFNPDGEIDFISMLELATGYITDRETSHNRSRSESLLHWLDKETQEVTLEIVGIYGVNDNLEEHQTFSYNHVFVPDSIIPTEWEQDVLYRNFSFVLTHPRYEEEFLLNYESLFTDFGFSPSFLENDWENFYASISPIRYSLILGILVFSLLLLIVFCLVITIYFVIRRKEYAIMRALGVSKKNASRETAFPLALFGFIGILSGGLVAWFFAIDRAKEILSDVMLVELTTAEEVYTELLVIGQLQAGWFFITIASLFILFVGLMRLADCMLTKQSPLELLQGSRLKNSKVIKNTQERRKGTGDAKSANEHKPLRSIGDISRRASSGHAGISILEASKERHLLKIGHMLRMVIKRVLYRKGRMIIVTLIASGFTITLSLMPFFIEQNKERVEWLYEHTEIVGTVIRDAARRGLWSVYVPVSLARETLRLQSEDDIPFITSYFATTRQEMAALPLVIPDDKLQEIIDLFPLEETGRTEVVAFNDPARYQSFFGVNITIEYLEGFDDSVFYQLDYEFPEILVSRSFQQQWNVHLGDYMKLYRIVERVCEESEIAVRRIIRGRHRIYRIVGIFETGSLELEVIVPLGYFQRQNLVPWYYPFEFTLNTRFNREIEIVQEALIEVFEDSRMPYVPIFRDEVLRDIVEPLERNIIMMENLYPIILGLSTFIAGGLLLLILASSMREVALMRVTGMSKTRVMVILFIENMLVLILGLAIGGLVTNFSFGYVNLLGLLLYLLGGVLAMLIFTIIFLQINPLRLLQETEK